MFSTLKGNVTLPGSKSESNRALMIAAYGGFPLEAEHLSDAHDTVLLQRLLQQISHATKADRFTIDGEDAGTVVRFLLTYLACRPGEWLLTGSERMRERPIAPLVDALRGLGAEIDYVDREGFLPLAIKGRQLQGGEAHVDASVSSQFVSSLLLAAPCWSLGLQLVLEGELRSQPYIEMTVAMMRHFGAVVVQEESVIVVQPRGYSPHPYQVQADWSAASYWYEFVALSNNGELFVKGLQPTGSQGDRKALEMFSLFGVDTRFESDGAWLSKRAEPGPSEAPLFFDVSNNPDLFPALMVTCVALHQPAVFHGTRNLESKESNRVVSIISELSKIYTFNNIIRDDSVVVEKSVTIYQNQSTNDLVLNTYDDHRIAMALAPLKWLFSKVTLDHPEVVVKSYPSYWIETQRLKVI